MEEIDTQKPETEEQKGQIRLDEAAAETSYANFFLVSTSLEEFVLSFGVRVGEAQTITIRDKIIVSPKNLKRMAGALGQSLKMYEERFGTIDTSVPSVQEPEKK